MKLAMLAAAACAVAFGAVAQGPTAGDPATSGDEASAGSANEQFRMGTMYDLGISGARDPAKALRWYLSAADAGHPEAQFNLAVMLDSGTEVEREPEAAALWYARAAAAGHTRAQYNLALLYAAGDGVPRNPALARAWFARAADALPAARGRDATLPVAASDIVAPETLSMHEGDRGATFVWTAAQSPENARFRVELLRSDDAGVGSVSAIDTFDTEVSAIDLSTDEGTVVRAWRVVQVDPASGAEQASAWERSGPLPGAARGLVRLRPRTGDDSAARLAASLAAALQLDGHLVMVAPGPVPEGASAIDLADDRESALAQSISAFLPGFGLVPIRRTDGGDEPISMTVSLVGGAAEPASPQPSESESTISIVPAEGDGRKLE